MWTVMEFKQWVKNTSYAYNNKLQLNAIQRAVSQIVATIDMHTITKPSRAFSFRSYMTCYLYLHRSGD